MQRRDFEALDARDPLGPVRDRFLLREGLIYMDGNSLGAPTRQARDQLHRVADEWEHDLIAGWFERGWYEAPVRVGARIAKLIGARGSEVVVSDNTTVNLHKAAAAALQERTSRQVVLIPPGDFPTDRYVLTELARLFGMRVEQVPAAELAGALTDDVALVTLTHVDYRTGAMHDMARLTRAAHQAGALILWDLCHSVGAVPLDLDGCDVDLAVGCTYKFLNGGPGAPAFVYANDRLSPRLRSPIPGWFGHADSFAFGESYEPAPDARRFLTGTSGILGLAALEGALRLWDDVDIAEVRSKSVLLGQYFIQLLDERCGQAGVEVISPRDGSQRGSQVSIRVAHAERVSRALAEQDVITDYRPPDVVRFGLTPLYTRFVDVWDAVDRLGLLLRRMDPHAAPE